MSKTTSFMPRVHKDAFAKNNKSFYDDKYKYSCKKEPFSKYVTLSI